MNYIKQTRFSLPCFKPVFLKVGGIAPLGAILNGKGAKTQKGRQGGETT